MITSVKSHEQKIGTISRDFSINSMTKLLIVEDEPLFRELLKRALVSHPGYDVIAETKDGETAVKLAQELVPDVVLMDIELAGQIDGIEAAIQIKKLNSSTGIVILSSHSDRRYVTSLPLENGRGWAYLLKNNVSDLESLVRAIEGSKTGMMVLDPAVVMGLRPRQGSNLSRLTPRQHEVLELLAQGYSNSAIAKRLVLSEKSIETYINAIYQELHLSNEREIHARVKATICYLQESQSR